MRRAILVGTVFLLSLAPSGLLAQGVISSDRPGLGDGVGVLGYGMWQVEGGVEVSGSDPTEVRLGQVLFRLGFLPFEARFKLNSVVLDDLDRTEAGWEDVQIGFKMPLGSASGSWTWAATGEVGLPLGKGVYTESDATVGAAFIGETSLSDAATLTLNGGYSFPFDGPIDGTVSLIVTPTFQMPSSDALSWYVGYAGFYGLADADFVMVDGEGVYDGPRAQTFHFLETGLAWRVGRTVQLDLNSGYDLEGERWFFGVGVAARFRHSR